MGALVDQLVGTALLMLGICAITDRRNLDISPQLTPAYVGALVLVIGMAFGHNCGYPLNPARDLSPRVFMLLAGWGWDVFAVGNCAWWLMPVVGPYIGAVLGACVYQLFVEQHYASADATAVHPAGVQSQRSIIVHSKSYDGRHADGTESLIYIDQNSSQNGTP